MPPPRLKAEFFIAPNGTIFPKDKQVTSAMRAAIYDRDGGRCQLCQEKVRRHGPFYSPTLPTPAAVDHIFPRSRGGRTTPNNLRLLCTTCNAQKGAR